MALLGPGLTGKTGIHVLSTALRAVVNGQSSGGEILNFYIGIQNDAPGALFLNFAANFNFFGVVNNANRAAFYNFKTDSSLDNGIVINSSIAVRLSHFDTSSLTENGIALFGANGAVLSDFSANNNIVDGALVTGGGMNVLSNFTADSNGFWGVEVMSSRNTIMGSATNPFDVSNNKLAGIKISCGPGTTGASSPPSTPLANGNQVSNGTLNGNGCTGIYIGRGSVGDQIFANTVNSSHSDCVGDDLIDKNATCVNTWTDNVFTSANSPCIH